MSDIIPIQIQCPQFFELQEQVSILEKQFHDMAEKLFTRVEILENKLKVSDE